MSYEPTLIIDRDKYDEYDFSILGYEKKYQKFYDRTDNWDTPGDFLHSVRNHQVHVIGGARVFLCQPEGTRFNKNVRNFLDKLGIQYWEDN